MIAELTAVMTAIRETANLAKVINDAKTDAEIKNAISELQSRLLMLQHESFTLGDLIRSRDEELSHVKAKLAEAENFTKESEGYVLSKAESGTLMYSKKQAMNGEELIVNACPQCFHHHKISILQPGITTGVKGGFFVHYCPTCKSEFKMNKLPPAKPLRIAGSGPRFGGNGGW